MKQDSYCGPQMTFNHPSIGARLYTEEDFYFGYDQTGIELWEENEWNNWLDHRRYSVRIHAINALDTQA